MFEKCVAIDWSGAENPRLNKKIQVAEYDSHTRKVSLVLPRSKSSKGRWSRAEVFEYVRCMAAEKRVLIGFDFAFAYPYCDKGEYFPGEITSPPDVQRLWQKVEEICSPAGNFYGGLFFRGQSSPFKDFHLCHDFKGPKYKERYRVTDEKAKRAAGRNPSSVFKCVGPSQVGPGSVAGMRFLREVRKETNISIWPFDTTGVPKDSTVVEIYPRLFLNCAGIGGGSQPTPDTVAKLHKCYQATLQDASARWTGDERDALISAAGMGWFARQPSVWKGPAGAARYEGWIFGVE